MTSATPGDRRSSALAFLLRHAAGDRHDRIVTLLGGQLTQLAEPRVQLLFGALPHAAGVDDDDVGLGLVGGGLEARLLEQPRHPLGVVHVHLAAEGLDQVFARHVVPVDVLPDLRCRNVQPLARRPRGLDGLRLGPFAFRPFAFAFRVRFALSPPDRVRDRVRPPVASD